MPKSNKPKQDTKKPKQIRLSPAISPTPPERAFVVQFPQHSEPATNWFSGRVEHMMSGQNVNFATSQELIEFFRQVLNSATPAVATRARPPKAGNAKKGE